MIRIRDRLFGAEVTGHVRSPREAAEFRSYAEDRMRHVLAGNIVARHMEMKEEDWYVRARVEVVVLTLNELYELIATEARRLNYLPDATVMELRGQPE